jgi:hypothetical protein
MGPDWLQRFAATATLTLLSVGCSEDQNREWINNDNEPVSVVNSNYCDGLIESQLERPDVDENPSTGVWRIEYPSFTSECGAYQLTGVFDFSDPERGGEPSYTYAIDACNRCEEQRNWNYLTNFSFPINSVGEGPPTNADVPRDPEIRTLTGVTTEGLPLVQHGSTEEPKNTELRCPVSTGWVLYEPIDQFRMASDVWNSQQVPLNFAPAADMILEASEAGSSETTILWPKLYHQEAATTGLQAASRIDHCAAAYDDGEHIPGQLIRPYDAPYDVEKKYVRQTTEFPELPQKFVDKLRQHVDGSDN